MTASQISTAKPGSVALKLSGLYSSTTSVSGISDTRSRSRSIPRTASAMISSQPRPKTTSRWIGVLDPDSNGPPGDYRFETFVELTADQAEDAVIVGTWTTDNSGVDVEIKLKG